MFKLAPAIVCAGFLLAPIHAHAQDAADADPPAHVSFVDGKAVIERDGQIDESPANMPLLAGDRVRTETGRVEILFADGSTLHLDNHTTVDFQSDDLVRLLDGRVRLTIGGRSRDVSYRIDAAHAWAQITQPGEYRLALMRRDSEIEVELAVLRGGAELINDDGRTALRAGERAFARRGVAPSYAYVFNSASWDAFDQWSEARRDYRLGLSAQYLPDQVRPYSRAFDTHGSWRHEPTYGYVWYPTVAVGWRPYYHGRWATLRPYGWVWIGADPWAWPTHHYGRWGFSAGSWFWIPGRTWGPGWVSWAYHPGYVSWCPLGWDNRPVFSLVNINVYRGYDPWSAWTVVPRHHFGTRYVHHTYIAGHRLDSRVRGAFEFRDSAPDFRGYAVPRSATAIRVAGTAVRRGSAQGTSPIYTNLPPDAARARSGSARIEVPSSPRSPRSSSSPRERAVPRDRGIAVSGDREAPTPDDRPRLTPERGVRSMPPARSGERRRPSTDAGDVRGSAEGRGDTAPQARPRDAATSPFINRTLPSRPATPARGAQSSVEGRKRGDLPSYGVPSYRREPAPERVPDTQASPRPPDSPGRAMPPRAPVEGRRNPGGWGAPAHTAPGDNAGSSPRPRALPSTDPDRPVAMPRSEPDRPVSMPRAMPRSEPNRPSAPPPRAMPMRERSAPSAPSTDAPRERAVPPPRGGRGGDAAGAARRRG